MKKLFLMLILIPFLGSCQVGKNKKEFEVDDKTLNRIHKEFIADCKKHGLSDVIRKKDLRVLDHQPLGYGLWGVTFPKARVILIDTTYMKGSYELLYIVTYHELAHFYLGAEHNKLCGSCIMQPYINLEEAVEMYNDIDTHKEQLFNTYMYTNPFFNVIFKVIDLK